MKAVSSLKNKRISTVTSIACQILLIISLFTFSAEAALYKVYESEVSAATKDAKVMSAGTSSLTSAIATQGSIPQVEHLDLVALGAQLHGQSLLQDPLTTVGDLTAAIRDYELAEANLDSALDNAWSSIALNPAVPQVIVDPLVLAMLDLHIQLRRVLGAGFLVRQG